VSTCFTDTEELSKLSKSLSKHMFGN